MGERQTTDLVVAALVMALGRRDPTGELVHHADHGCQYTSVEFTNRLADWGLAGSYGSVGDCFDNAAMEAFWATLKKEIRHIWGPIEQFTRSEMRTILFDYIEVFYNDTVFGARNVRSNPGIRARPNRTPDPGSRPSRIAVRSSAVTVPSRPSRSAPDPNHRPGGSPCPA